MPNLRNAVLAGVAALGIGLSGVASAQSVHVTTVPVPGGGLAEIHYIGDVPPQVVFVPAPLAFDSWVPAASFFDAGSPFAMLDRISAEMDRRMRAMFRYAEAAADRARPGRTVETGFGALPPGSQGYSYVATMSGNSICAQSVRITSDGHGPPRIERHSSGNCGPSAAAPAPSAVLPPVPARPMPRRQPDLILTDNTGAPHQSALQLAAARR